MPDVYLLQVLKSFFLVILLSVYLTMMAGHVERVISDHDGRSCGAHWRSGKDPSL